MSKQFCFIRCRRQHVWGVEWKRNSRFTFVENTISNSPKIPRVKFLWSDGLFCFSSICKFGTLLEQLLAFLNFNCNFRLRRFILLLQTKKVISMNYGSSANSWKPWRWVRLDLILTWGIYTLIPTWTHSQNSPAAAEAMNLKIPSHGTSLKWSQRLSVSIETETTRWSELRNIGKATVEQILVPEEKNEFKRAGLWESQSGIWVWTLTIRVRSFEIEKL